VNRFTAHEPLPNNPPAFVSRYIVLRLNKEVTKATLREWKWSDEQINIVDSMSDKSYVGYIAKEEQDSHPEVFRIHLLRQGLPVESLTSDMCIAVQPNTDETCLPRQEKQHDHYDHHKHHRTPLRLDQPLPWKNCYHSSFENLLVRIPSLSKDTGRYKLSPDERKRHGNIIGKDFHNLVVRQNKLLAKIHANESVPTRAPSPAPPPGPRITLWEVMGEPIMSVHATPLKSHYAVKYVPQPPDPAELMAHQKDLVQIKNHTKMTRESGPSTK